MLTKLLACAACAAALAIAASSCGPSFQAVYEGDVQFEHCYAVDESTNATFREKGDCWREWTRSYTYGQTRDRIEYAASRRDALITPRNFPTDDFVQEAAAGGGARKKVISAPAPTSIFAPPPNTMHEPEDAGARDASALRMAPGPSSRAPGAECSDACGRTWQACKDGCRGDKPCRACEETHSKCMLACFAPDAGATPRR